MLPSLQGLDRAGRVIYLGTFSKLLFPSLRLGYAVLPEDLVLPFTAARHLTDRQSSGLTQAVMTEFILDGHFARHLKRMRALYADRQAFLIEQVTCRIRRHPERAHYDRETVFAILDAALLCHVGYVIDGRPYVTPTLFWRDGERLYWHGSSASRMLRTQRAGIRVCLTVSHVDGLVLARS